MMSFRSDFLDREQLRGKSGIYKIVNNLSGKIYVGQAFNLLRRLQKHLNLKSSLAITVAIKKHGLDNFSYDILEYCNPNDLNDKESFWISNLKSSTKEFGYNIKPKGYNSRGYKLSKEAAKNISNARKKWVADNPEQSKVRHLKIKQFYNTIEGKAFLSKKAKDFLQTEKGKANADAFILRLKGNNYTGKKIKFISENGVVTIYPSMAAGMRGTGWSEKKIQYNMGLCKNRVDKSRQQWHYI